MELEYEVTNRSAFIAAVKAACQNTYDKARATPVKIKNGTATYTFKQGIHETRATELVREIKRTPERVFHVAD